MSTQNRERLGTARSGSKLLFSINDAAYALSVSRGTIYREIKAGRLKYLQHGSRKFISRQALESWIRDRELETNVWEGRRVCA